MKTHIASLSFAFFLLTGGLVTAGSCIDSYWPLNDEDTKTCVYGGTNQLTMNTADNGGGEYEIETRTTE
jgi:hypothetical protein